MAQRDRYCNPDSVGGDGTTANLTGATAAYASMTTAEVNEADDFVTATDNLYLHCAGVTNADTTCNWNGSTTSATYDIMVEGDNDTGVWSTSHYRMISSTGFAGILTANDAFITFKNIQVENSSAASNNPRGIELLEADATVQNCIVNMSGTGTPGGFNAGIIQNYNTAGCNIINNIVYGNASRLIWIYDTSVVSTHYLIIYNNTVINKLNSVYGIQALDSGNPYPYIQVVNNIVDGCGTSDYNTGVLWVSNGNISSDTSSPTVAGRSISLTFVDAANDDYHLASTDTSAMGFGAGPTADSYVPTIDIDNDVRSGATTDSGADLSMYAGLEGTLSLLGVGI